MKHFFRKLTAFVLVGLSAFAMTACGDPSGPLGPGETIDVSFTGVIDTDLEILFESFAADGISETYYDNRYTDLYRDELGINVKYHWVAQGWDQKLQKLSLDLISGDLADVITFDSLDMAQAAYEDGYTLDLREVFDEYASDLVKEQAESDSSAIMMKACTSDDGALFAIPGFTHLLNQSPIVYIRKDWLDNLGLEVPSNREELIAVMKAFRDDDPDGNGKKDTFGIGLTGNFVQYQGEINGYTEMFGGYPFDWIENDDGSEIVYGGVQPEAKEGLKFLRELYQGGYIDPEFISKDCNDLMEDIAAGKVGLCYAPYWLIENALHTGWTRDKNMEWVYCPVYDGEGVAKVNADSFARQYIAINREFKYPEKIIEMINLYHEMCFGENNEFDKYFMDGKYPNLWHLSPLQFVDSRENGCTVYYRECMKLIEGTMDYDDAQYISRMVYDIHKKIEGGASYKDGTLTLAEWKRYNYYGPHSTSAVLAQYEDAKSYKVSYVYKPTVRNTIGSLQMDKYLEFITGKNADIEKSWAGFCNSWRSRGGADQLREYNEWYQRRYKA